MSHMNKSLSVSAFKCCKNKFSLSLKYKKGFIGILLSFCLIILTVLPENVMGATTDSALEVNAHSAILLDVASNKVIYEKNADEAVAPSGIFKTMSLLLFMEAMDRGELSMDTMITVSQSAAKLGGMSAFLDANAQYSTETLLKSVAMISANDACLALAEKLCGSEEVFVKRMNDRAKELGLTNTVFTNATGMNDTKQHSTARDLAIISQALIKYDKLLKLSKQYMESIKHNEGRVSELTNPNRLVRFYAGCDGLQTGSNNEAKYCICATALRENQRLVCVVLGANNNSDRNEAAGKLLDYGFANYTSVLLIRKNDVIKKNAVVKSGIQTTVPLVAKDQLALLLTKGAEKGITKEIELDENLIAPLEEGQKVGIIKFVKDGIIVAQTDIITQVAVERASIMDFVIRIINYWF